ncbi:MAG: adenine deaminase [Chloroflexi bacterium]|nr:adenine deaminase [Chloroflexota bacterium]
MDEKTLAELIRVAKGDEPAEIVLKGGKVADLAGMRFVEGDVAIHRGLIMGIGDYKGIEEVDVSGKVITPGFMDSHVHIESSMVSPIQFAKAVVPLGTTTVVADPHEITNVCGLNGFRYMLSAGGAVPLDINLMVPSCVPATHMETSGADLEASDLLSVKNDKGVLGLAEMMNYPGVLFQDPGVLNKLLDFYDRPIDGHAPMLSGNDLNAYRLAGPSSEHESTTAEEALAKLKAGMQIFVREGSVTRDLESLLPAINLLNFRFFSFATDDREPVDLIEEGHINFLLRKAVRLGLDPIVAISMACYNSIPHYRFIRRGLIAPGFRADVVVLNDTVDFIPYQVYVEGKLVAQNGQALFTPGSIDDSKVLNTVNIGDISPDKLKVKSDGGDIRVMEIIPNQIVTKALTLAPKVVDGEAVSDTERDILKVAVVERHKATGNVGVGFVRGFGLKKGAVSSTVAHDSHNLIIIGTNDDDMMTLIKHTVQMQGGQAVACNGKVLADLPLAIGGLMSTEPLPAVKDRLEKMFAAAGELGSALHSPFMAMAFLALPVVPELKITDEGYVDVTKFERVPVGV